MFGYLIVNPTQLDKEDKQIYRGFYCGLCHELNKSYGNTGRKTLSYDLTFVSLVLASVHHLENTYGFERCPIHPIVPHQFISNEVMEFTAAMNMVLSYYKCLDDYQDENKKKAQVNALKLEPFVLEIKKKYSQQVNDIEQSLAEINNYEKHNVLDPDLLSNTFGKIMVEVFRYKDNQPKELESFAFHLGKFIYLLDASLDLKSDIKKELYNPLIAIDSTHQHEMLEMVMADCVKEFEKLHISEYQNIIENVLYSGAWSKYYVKKKGLKDEGSL